MSAIFLAQNQTVHARIAIWGLCVIQDLTEETFQSNYGWDSMILRQNVT